MWLTVASRRAQGTADEAWIQQMLQDAMSVDTPEQRSQGIALADSLEREVRRTELGEGAEPHQIANCASTGTWSLGRSPPLTSVCTMAPSSRSASCGDSSRWSMRMPSLRSQPKVLKS
jgi:hypothetical protein